MRASCSMRSVTSRTTAVQRVEPPSVRFEMPTSALNALPSLAADDVRAARRARLVGASRERAHVPAMRVDRCARQQHVERLADHLVGRVAEHAGGAGVEDDDALRAVDRDDAVGGHLQHFAIARIGLALRVVHPRRLDARCGRVGENAQQLDLPQRERLAPRDAIEVDHADQAVARHHRQRQRRLDLRARMARHPARIADLSHQHQRLAVRRDPAGCAFRQRRALAQQRLACAAAHGGDLQLAAVLGNEHDRHLVRLELGHRGFGDPVEQHLRIERMRDRLVELVDLDGVAQLHVLQAQPAHAGCARKHRQQGGELDRLQHVVERAGLHRLHRRLDRAHAGHQHADEVRIDLARGGQQRHAVHAGHHQVGQQQVVVRVAQRAQRVLAVGESRGLVAVASQRVAQRPHRPRLVVDDQDARRSGAHPARPQRLASASRSSRSFGGLLSTRSTHGGISPSATSRCPQPVSRITGVAGRRGLDRRRHLAAVDVRHAEIGDDRGEAAVAARALRGTRRCPRWPPLAVTTVAVALQRVAQRLEQHRIVVDDQHAQARRRGAARAPAVPIAGRLRQRIGNTRRTVVPLPGALSISRSAPCRCDHAVHHREAEAGAALALGGEERLEAAAPRLLVHADAGVADLDRDAARGAPAASRACACAASARRLRASRRPR